MDSLNQSLISFLTLHNSGTGILIAYAVIFLILFAESGLLIAFFLPGDSLLIALGVLAPSTHLSLPVMVIVAATAAILGNSTGYAIGHWAGPELLQGKSTKLLKPYVVRTHEYFERYGKSTLIIARFTPVLRTFVPTIAGISQMNYPAFLLFNAIGSIIWAVTIIVGGFLLAKYVPSVTAHITLIEALILLASITVAVNHLMSMKAESKK